MNYFVHLTGVIKEVCGSKYALKEPALLFEKKIVWIQFAHHAGFSNVTAGGEYNNHSDLREVKFHKTILLSSSAAC